MFSHKGDRDYIHSSDIINFINRNYLYNKIDIKFYKLLRFQPKIRLINKLGNSRGVNIIAKIEKNKKYKTSTLCEPFLSSKGLKNTLSKDLDSPFANLIMDFLSLCDGQASLLEIAERLNTPIWDFYDLINELESKKLLNKS